MSKRSKPRARKPRQPKTSFLWVRTLRLNWVRYSTSLRLKRTQKHLRKTRQLLILLERQQDLARVQEKQLEIRVEQQLNLLWELEQSQLYRSRQLLPEPEPSSTLELDHFLGLEQ